MNRENTTPFAVILLLILGTESIVAFLGNGFIIVVNGHRWLQSRKMLPCDLLLTVLGTTRFLLQLVVTVSQLLKIYSSEIFCDNYLWRSFFSAFIYFSSASIWCCTWLSVLYCVKVTNFAHRLFLWFKPRINVLVPRLLGLSLTVFSLPSVVSCLRMNSYCSLMGSVTRNTSQGDNNSNNYQFWIFISLYFTFIAISVSICITASILLLISLWRHTRNLKRSGVNIKDLSTQAHINVVNSLLFFLFFYILHVVALEIYLSGAYRASVVEKLVAHVVLSLCPSAHSIILILTNPKLKEVCTRILKIRQRT